MRSLILGGGQLGTSLLDALGPGASIATGIPWADPPAAAQRIRATVAEFLAQTEGGRWMVCWSAGRGVVGTAEAELRHERAALDVLLATVAETSPRNRALGSLFVASSAGGIYAAGAGTACTELTQPSPTSDYGRSKLLQDRTVLAWAADHQVRTLVGRISNLYGPKQDLRKPQGFISHLCRAMANRTLFTLTVPVSTIRDFVYTDDVSRRIARWALDPTRPPTADIKLLVAGRSVTLGHVIAMTKAISRTPPRVLLADRRGTDDQPAALRFRSVALTDLDDAIPARPLEEGIRNTWAATMRALERGA